MSKSIFITFLLLFIFQIVFSQKINNGIYRSDSSKHAIEVKLVFKDVDSVRMELIVYDDLYFLNGTYKIYRNKFNVKSFHSNTALSGNAYNYDKITNKDSVLNLKIKLCNNTKVDTTPMNNVVIYCKEAISKRLFSRVETKNYTKEIAIDIPTDFIPFDIHILSKDNRETIINVTKNFDYSYIVYLAHALKIVEDNGTDFKAKIRNVTNRSFELLINNQFVLMKLDSE